MNLYYAVDRLYEVGWLPTEDIDLERLSDGRRFPSVMAVQQEFARAAETDATRAKRGLSNPKAERIAPEARRPIAEHVADLVAAVRSA